MFYSYLGNLSYNNIFYYFQVDAKAIPVAVAPAPIVVKTPVAYAAPVYKSVVAAPVYKSVVAAPLTYAAPAVVKSPLAYSSYYH